MWKWFLQRTHFPASGKAAVKHKQRQKRHRQLTAEFTVLWVPSGGGNDGGPSPQPAGTVQGEESQAGRQPHDWANPRPCRGAERRGRSSPNQRPPTTRAPKACGAFARQIRPNRLSRSGQRGAAGSHLAGPMQQNNTDEQEGLFGATLSNARMGRECDLEHFATPTPANTVMFLVSNGGIQGTSSSGPLNHRGKIDSSRGGYTKLASKKRETAHFGKM